jgi:hypothetical protein
VLRRFGRAESRPREVAAPAVRAAKGCSPLRALARGRAGSGVADRHADGIAPPSVTTTSEERVDTRKKLDRTHAIMHNSTATTVPATISARLTVSERSNLDSYASQGRRAPVGLER